MLRRIASLLFNCMSVPPFTTSLLTLHSLPQLRSARRSSNVAVWIQALGSEAAATMDFNDANQTFELHEIVWLMPGLAHIKFVVDGNWILLSRQHVFHDWHGNPNNAVEITREGDVRYFEVRTHHIV